jgi:hypothetical protein
VRSRDVVASGPKAVTCSGVRSVTLKEMLISQYPKLLAGYGKGDNDYDRIQEALKDY